MYNYKQKDQNKHRPNRKKIALILTALILTAGLIGGGLYIRNRRGQKSADTPRVATINYAPATPAEKQQVNDTKDKIVADQNKAKEAPQATGTKKSVTPTITNTTGSISAYVMGVFEEGGTCTATFVKSGETLSKSSVGFQNASYTQCSPIPLESGYLSKGTWTVTVSYSSAAAEGTSLSKNFEVN